MKNLTKPRWAWTLGKGNLRMGWMSRKDWLLYGAYGWSWFFVFKNYPIVDNKGGFWQITILGLQIGCRYKRIRGYKQKMDKVKIRKLLMAYSMFIEGDYAEWLIPWDEDYPVEEFLDSKLYKNIPMSYG